VINGLDKLGGNWNKFAITDETSEWLKAERCDKCIEKQTSINKSQIN